MLRRLHSLALLQVAAVIFSTLFTPASAEESRIARETQLLEVLRSNASLAQKDAACAELKLLATTNSVPILSELLLKEELTQSARYVLESMQSPEAGAALRKALPLARGAARIGIIHSLGLTKDLSAIPELRSLLRSGEPQLAAAAAASLGRIGGGDALEALEEAIIHSQPAAPPAVLNAALTLAETARLDGDLELAARAFKKIVDSSEAPQFQVAAFRGLILCAGPDAGLLLSASLSGTAGPKQVAALAAACELPGQQITQSLIRALRRTSSVVQVALLEALAQRQDSAAVPAIVEMLDSHMAEVRVAAIAALGRCGDGASVPKLAQFAANGLQDERAAARAALVILRGMDIQPALLRALAQDNPAIQAEVARTLAERGDKAAMGQLLALVRNAPPVSRAAMLEAAAVLAEDSHLVELVELVVQADGEGSREQAAEALNTAYQRLLVSNGRVDLVPLLRAADTSDLEVRAALLPVCAGIVHPETRAVLIKAAGESLPRIREAAIRALAASNDPALLPELSRLGCSLAEPNLRSLAISGCVRLVNSDETRANVETRIVALRKLLNCNPSAEQVKMIISGLAQIPDVQSLELVEGMLADSAVSSEASRALLQIAPGIQDTQRSLSALEKAIATLHEPEARKQAEAVLNQVLARADYLRAWEVAGPYDQDGKNYAALFDTPLAPEQEGAQVNWRRLSSGDPQRPEVIDFLKEFGGEQRVAYARTWVYSPTEQAAMLELGSDDGAKVWLNGSVVHANNTARPLQPGSDKAPIKLKAGWNALLFKVTQNNLGWEFCARILKEDGSRLPGLKHSSD